MITTKTSFDFTDLLKTSPFYNIGNSTITNDTLSGFTAQQRQILDSLNLSNMPTVTPTISAPTVTPKTTPTVTPTISVPTTTPTTTPTVATPQTAIPVTPPTAAPGAIPEGRSANVNSTPVGNYLGKAVNTVASNLVNTAGLFAGKNTLNEADKALQNKFKDDQTAFGKAVEQKATDSAQHTQTIQDSIYKLSDTLKERAERLGQAADTQVKNPVVRGIANFVTDMAPFFALNAIPGVGEAVAGAELIGGASGELRRAGYSEGAQTAASVASVLSMGVAGQVGKAIASEPVTKWFANNGKGPALARLLEQAMTKGVVTGTARQATTMAVNAAGGVYGEQVQQAQNNIGELQNALNTATLTQEERDTIQNAITANQAVIDSGGLNWKNAMQSILMETLFDLGTVGIDYAMGKYKDYVTYVNVTESKKASSPTLDPKNSKYFKKAKDLDSLIKLNREYSREYADVRNRTETVKDQRSETLTEITTEFNRIKAFFAAQNAHTVSKAYADAASGQPVNTENVNTAIAGLLSAASEDELTANAAQQIVTAVQQDMSQFMSQNTVGPVASDLVQKGFSLKTAKRWVEILTKLSNGEEVSNRDIQRINPASPDTKQLVADHYGVTIPNLTGLPLLDAYRGISTETQSTAINEVLERQIQAPWNRTEPILSAPQIQGSIETPVSPASNEAIDEFASQKIIAENGETMDVQQYMDYAKSLVPDITEERVRAVFKQHSQQMENLRGMALSDDGAYAIRYVPLRRRINAQGTSRYYIADLETGEAYRDKNGKLKTYKTQKGALRFINDLTYDPSEFVDMVMRDVDRISAEEQIRTEPVEADLQSAETESEAPSETELRTLLEAPRGFAQINGFEYTVSKLGDNLYSAKIERATDRKSGPPIISNAYNTMYNQSFPNREEAVDTLVRVAHNNDLLKQKGGAIDNGNRSDSERVPDGGRISESSGTGRTTGGLQSAVDAEVLPADEGARETGVPPERRGEPVVQSGSGDNQPADVDGRSVSSGRSGGVTPRRGTDRASGTGDAGQGLVKEAPAESSEQALAEASEQAPAETSEKVPAEAPEQAQPKASEQAKTTEPKERKPKEPGTTLTDPQKEELKRADDKALTSKGKDYVIQPGTLSPPTGQKARFNANIDAIKLANQIIAEGRPATPEEQRVLANYSGWGAIPQAFDKLNDKWAKEYAQLKELLPKGEYNAAKASTTNAHYTSEDVINGIYSGMEALGFKGGRLLEPSAGIGNFAGLLPAQIRGKSAWSMVELDKTTGKILGLLYPNADVRVMGFQDTVLPDNYYDAAISNVPFSNVGVVDKNYPSYVTGSLHNYFFAKALDKIRPGGLVTFITSSYTMDAATKPARDMRLYLSQKADFLGGVRLPNNAFKDNAGTDVVTDILVFKKREPNTPYAGEDFIDSKGEYLHYEPDDGGYRNYLWYNLNNYWAEHPGMVLGTVGKGKMYSDQSVTWNPLDTKDPLSKQITDAISKIDARMDYPVKPTPEQAQVAVRQAKQEITAKDGTYVERDGKLKKVENGQYIDANLKGKRALIMRDASRIATIAHRLLDLQLSNTDNQNDAAIKNQRNALNASYDAFVKQYGPLHKPRTVVPVLRKTTDAGLLLSLETYDNKTGEAQKSDIFTRDTVTPVKDITHVDTLQEGVYASINNSGTIDADYIAQLMSRPVTEVRRELLDTGTAFLSIDGNLEPSERYLSGNVRQKLKDAIALAEMNPEYKRNVEALKEIVPDDIPAENIQVRPGMTWIPTSIYEQFISHILNGRDVIPQYDHSISVTHNAGVGYNVQLNSKYKYVQDNVMEWGTRDAPFSEIFPRTLNNQPIKVNKRTPDGTYVLDKQATEAAIEKQTKIIAEFQKWLWSDAGRREQLGKVYNDTFNANVNPRYDGSKLVINGLNSNFKLYKHQSDFVKRVLMSSGPVYNSHQVGAGKTLATISSVMVLRQTGAVKKPLFVVPKNLVSQWESDWHKFYPAAKVLVASEDTFAKQNRQAFVSSVATGDWDAVLMADSQFYRIPMSAKAREEFYDAQVEILETAIENARLAKTDNRTIKQIEAAKNSLLNNLKKAAETDEKDNLNIDFESLGVDSLVVDEFHNYKNLMFYTNLGNSVAGLGTKQGSKRAMDMWMKTLYLQKITGGGRGIIYASATPITNSAAELYTVMRFTMNNAIESLGIRSFDDFVSMFGDIRTETELKPSGTGYRNKQVLSRFRNTPELQRLVRGSLDVINQVEGLKLPEIEGGKMQVVVCKPSDAQKEIIQSLVARADALSRGHIDPKEDNMLNVTTDARKLSYTARYFHPELPYEKTGKIITCATKVKEIYDATNAEKGTQLIFCDLATPKGTKEKDTPEDSDDEQNWGGLDLYNDIKNMLIAQGIPAQEIAFIHDAKNDAERLALYDKVNGGDVRVLIGSTSKLGVGANIQTRLRWLHHMDCPWRPGDIEQRNGRIVRQGNTYDKVGITAYVTEGTFDALMWDRQERKARFIYQLMHNPMSERDVDVGGDFAMNAADIKAAASGDPRIKQQHDLSVRQRQLEDLEQAYNNGVEDARAMISNLERRVSDYRLESEKLKRDIKTRKDVTGDKFTLTVGATSYKNRKEAGEAIIAESQSFITSSDRPKELRLKSRNKKAIGEFAGFRLSVDDTGAWFLDGAKEYTGQVNFASPTGTITALEHRVSGLDKTLVNIQANVEKANGEIAKYKESLKKPFEYADELKQVRTDNQRLTAELSDSSGITAKDGQSEEVHAKRSFNNESQWRTTKLTGDAPKVPFQQVLNNIRTQKPKNFSELKDAVRNGEPETLSELLDDMRNSWGIQVTVGKMRYRNTEGEYSDKNQGIRIREANDLIAYAHELGHHLDHLHKIAENLPDDVKCELVDNLDPEFRKGYDDDELPNEGIAEFTRRFLTNRETAAIDYPKAYKHIMGNLPGRDVAQLMADSYRVNSYLVSAEDSAAPNIRERDYRPPDPRSAGQRISDAKLTIIAKAQDSLAPLKKLAQDYNSPDVAKKFYNLPYSSSKAAGILNGDLYGIDGQWLAPGLNTAVHGIRVNDKREFADFGEYLDCKRGLDLLPRGIRVFGNDAQNTSSFMRKRIDALENKYPEFKAASDRIYKYWRAFGQEYFVNSGLIAQKAFDDMWENDPHYIPLQRVVPKGRASGKAESKSPVQRIFGSGRDPYNPVDNMIQLTPKIIALAMENAARLDLADLCNEKGVNATWMERIPTPVRKQTVDVSARDARIKNQLSETLPDNYMEALVAAMDDEGDLMDVWTRGQPTGNVIAVYRDGKPEYWQINDPILYDALSGMDRTRRKGIGKIWAQATREFTQNVTGRLFIWSLTANALSDLQTAAVFSRNNEARLKLLPYILKTWGENLKKSFNSKNVDPIHLEWLAMGGMNMFDGAEYWSPVLARKTRRKWEQSVLSLNPFTNFVRFNDFISKCVENGPREATYWLARNDGLEPYQAFRLSMEVTTDFKISGEWSRDLSAIFPFANAQIQGTAHGLNVLAATDVPKNDRAKTAASRIFALVLMSAIGAATNYAMHNISVEERDSYALLSNFTKNSYWSIPMGDHKYLTFRKPREVAALESLFERLLDTYAGGNKHALDEFGQYALNESLPSVISDVVQGNIQGAIGDFTVIGAIHNIGLNRDFQDRPIVPSALEDLEPKLQYTGTTSKLAKAIGEFFNFSPIQIDYFNENGAPIPFFGAAWQYQRALFPVDDSKRDITLGVQRRFERDALYSQDVVNALYDMRTASDRASNSDPSDMEKKITAKRDANMASFYSRYYTLSKEEEETNLTRALRARVLSDLESYRDAREAEAYTDSEKAVYQVVTKAGDTEGMLPVVRQSNVTYAGKEYTLTAAQYYDYQGDYNRIYYDIVDRGLPRMKTDAQREALLKQAVTQAGTFSKNNVLRQFHVTTKESEKTSGLSAVDIAVYNALRDTYDADGSGKLNGTESATGISSMTWLTDKEKARLWQYANSNSSAKNNPFIPPRIISSALHQRDVDVMEYAMSRNW